MNSFIKPHEVDLRPLYRAARMGGPLADALARRLPPTRSRSHDDRLLGDIDRDGFVVDPS